MNQQPLPLRPLPRLYSLYTILRIRMCVTVTKSHSFRRAPREPDDAHTHEAPRRSRRVKGTWVRLQYRNSRICIGIAGTDARVDSGGSLNTRVRVSCHFDSVSQSTDHSQLRSLCAHEIALSVHEGDTLARARCHLTPVTATCTRVVSRRHTRDTTATGSRAHTCYASCYASILWESVSCLPRLPLSPPSVS